MATVPNAADTVEGVLALVRQRGRRITSARRLLLEALFAAQRHQTAEELAATLQARAPDFHLSTIYRNLDDLEQLGVIVHAHLGHGAATYHLAATAHGQLVCQVRDAVIEAPNLLFVDPRPLSPLSVAP